MSTVPSRVAPSRFALSLPFLLLLSLFAWMVTEPSLLLSMRHAVFDHYQRWFPAQSSTEPVAIVDIDDESLARFGQWPWPRTLLAQLHQRMIGAGATAVAYDILFAEPDRTSPRALISGLPLTPESASEIMDLPDHDQVMGDSLTGTPAVLGFALGVGQRADLPVALVSRFAVRDPALLAQLPAHGAGLFPIPELARQAGAGSINFLPDSDGVLRRVPMVMRFGEMVLPALSLELVRLHLGASGFTLQANPLSGLEVGLGPLRVPIALEGEGWVRYAPYDSARYVPAWKVLDDDAVAHTLRGRPVLVGSSAPALLDLRFSPLGRVVPGVEVHAQLVDGIRDGTLLVRPKDALAVEALVLLVMGALVGGLGLQLRATPAVLCTVVVLTGVLLGGVLAFLHWGLLLDPLVPAALSGLVFLSASVVRHSDTERRQRWMRTLFSRYVSPNLVAYLVSHPDSVKLGGERRECSFIFTDLAGYTSLMETQDPAAVVSQVNQYLDGMIEIVFRHQGTLMKIIGDGLVIMFSAPLVQPDHARRALACALELDAFAVTFAQRSAGQGLKWGETRIGVHSGEVIVGNFGGGAIRDYSALGDPINTASRLEGANKYLGTRICVSADTVARCLDAVVRRIGPVVLKGRASPVEVNELIGIGRDCPEDADYNAAYELLVQGGLQASMAFRALATQRPADRLVQMQAARLVSDPSGAPIVLEGK